MTVNVIHGFFYSLFTFFLLPIIDLDLPAGLNDYKPLITFAIHLFAFRIGFYIHDKPKIAAFLIYLIPVVLIGIKISIFDFLRSGEFQLFMTFSFFITLLLLPVYVLFRSSYIYEQNYKTGGVMFLVSYYLVFVITFLASVAFWNLVVYGSNGNPEVSFFKALFDFYSNPLITLAQYLTFLMLSFFFVSLLGAIYERGELEVANA